MSQAGIFDIEGTHPQIPTSFDTNMGTAIPIGNVLEILGDTVANGTYPLPLYTTGSGNTVTAHIQVSTEITGAPLDNNDAGIASFNDTQFTVDANGYVSLVGGSDLPVVQSVTGDDLDPVFPNGTGTILFVGSVVDNGNNAKPVYFEGNISPNTETLEIQVSKALLGLPPDKLDVGLCSFDINEFTVTSNGFVQLVGGGINDLTITTDDASVVSPVANNWNVSGLGESSTQSDGDPNVQILSPRCAKWVVDPTLYYGTHQTITAAIAAASSGETIVIRPGTYVEDLTLKAGVSLCAFEGDGETSNVKIDGKITASYTGSASIAGCRLSTNADFLIECTGAGLQTLDILNCYLECDDNCGIHITNSNASSEVRVFDCIGNLSSLGVCYIEMAGAGRIRVEYCRLENTASSLANSLVDSGALTIEWSTYKNAITTSTTGQLGLLGVTMELPNITAITHGSNVESSARYSRISTGTATSISVGTGSSFVADYVQFKSTNATSVIDGLGTVRFYQCGFEDAGNKITSTIQIPIVVSNDAVQVTTPAAYPYTATPQDGVILVDSAGGVRTINLNASPVTGQIYRIKDASGNAGTNNITITPAAGNIDGAASYTMTVDYMSRDVCFNGSEWSIL